MIRYHFTVKADKAAKVAIELADLLNTSVCISPFDKQTYLLTVEVWTDEEFEKVNEVIKRL